MKKEFICCYHDEEATKIFLGDDLTLACKLICPLNPSKICYRWAICFGGKKINVGKNEENNI